MHGVIQQAMRVESLAGGAIFSWAVVVAARVLMVALPIVGVGNELGVAAVGSELAVAWASVEAVIVAASVSSSRAASAPLPILVIRFDRGIFVGVALGDVEQLGDGDIVPANAL
jgi:hypothetical protein